MERSATISRDGLYRYELVRSWSDEQHVSPQCVTWVMLNPSTADAEVDDPTIRRCIGFTKREGYTKLRVVNLFAYRATQPDDLARVQDPRGPENFHYVERAIRGSALTIFAWGAGIDKVFRAGHPRLVPEAMATRYSVPAYALGRTKSGHPRHPLYLGTYEPLELYP